MRIKAVSRSRQWEKLEAVALSILPTYTQRVSALVPRCAGRGAPGLKLTELLGARNKSVRPLLLHSWWEHVAVCLPVSPPCSLTAQTQTSLPLSLPHPSCFCRLRPWPRLQPRA